MRSRLLQRMLNCLVVLGSVPSVVLAADEGVHQVGEVAVGRFGGSCGRGGEQRGRCQHPGEAQPCAPGPSHVG